MGHLVAFSDFLRGSPVITSGMTMHSPFLCSVYGSKMENALIGTF